jgi:hypothetical protein
LKPILTITDVIENIDMFEKSSQFYSFFLYRYTDRNVVSIARLLVEKHIRLYDEVPLFYFLIEDPMTKHKKDWKEKIGLKNYSFLERSKDDPLWKTDTLPYDSSNLYKISKLLEIKEESIPCMILFRNMSEKDVIVWRITNVWSNNVFNEIDHEVCRLIRSFLGTEDKYERINAEIIRDEYDTSSLEDFCKYWNTIFRSKKDIQCYYIKYSESIRNIFTHINSELNS